MKNKVITNLIWRFLEKSGAQLVTLFISIVLARILSPSDYGQIAIITVIITLFNVFVDGGLANALIQKKTPDDLDYTSVFYFNIAFCLLLYSLAYLMAPAIGAIYNTPDLIPMFRVLALTIIISGIKNVQQAYVSKNFLFKRFFFSTLAGTIFSAILGVIMALKGFGAWAIIAQHLSNTLIDTVVLWLTVKWRPIKRFSILRLKSLFSYGYKLLLSTLLNTISSSFMQLIIGKQYTSSDLAYYNRGRQFPSLIMTNINASIDSVLFPAMSEKQNDLLGIKDVIKKSISIGTYVLWPMLFGLFALAEPFVKVVLTEKWILTAPYIRVFCIAFATFPLQTANLNALKSIGRSDTFFYLEIKQSIIGMVLMITALPFGPLWIAIMSMVTSIISTYLICCETKKHFNYSFYTQLKDVAKNLLLSIIMCIIVFSVSRINSSVYLLLVEITLGVIIYIIGSMVTRNNNFYYLKSLIINLVSRH